MLKTPVLFIIFNKPLKTQAVFNAIKQVEPEQLFVVADGMRIGNEIDLVNCPLTRKIVDQIDWKCDLKTLFREENLGCGRGPSEAISWFFNQVEEGIVIEDDCVPNVDFFFYCQELLLKYRNNNDIMSIGGVNFQDGKRRGNASYYFSKHNAIWGWASWKRVWVNYDYYISNISKHEFEDVLSRTFSTKSEKEYWLNVFDNVKLNRLNDSCWDYQLMFMIWKMNGLAVLPNKNLVSNIGFDDDATHTYDTKNPCSNLPTENILPLKHPQHIYQNKSADLYYHRKCLVISKFSKSYLKRKLKNLYNKLT